jgi:DNA-binding CsgD family transcriptional regulator
MTSLSRLKRIREERALSQRDLAARSGVAQDTISELERGERQARPSTVRKLAEALGVDASLLLTDVLTPRQLEILSLIVQGYTNRQIAEELYLSQGTLRLHIEHIMVKLGVSNCTQTAVKALQLGILDAGSAPTRAREERRTPETEVEAEGRLAESSVTGQSAAAIEDEDMVLNSDDDYPRYTLLLPRKARQEQRNIAWAKLDSGDLEDIFEVVQDMKLVIHKVLEDLGDKQASLETIPRRYFEDYDAQRRIEKRRVALREYQHEVIQTLRELVELYVEAMRRLEDAIEVMRKEGGELIRVVHQAVPQIKSKE